MAYALRSNARSTLPAISLTLFWRGTQRSWKIKRSAALMAAALLSLVGLWYLGATAYLVFHDQLVASLISHQAEVQYSYEDRIAVLQTQLDREISRGLIDRQTLDTTIQSLASKSKLLESRSATMDIILRSIGAESSGAPNGGGSNSLPSSSALSYSPQPSPGDPVGAGARDDHTELSPLQRGEVLQALLDNIEARQADGIVRLRTPVMKRLERIQAALIDTGLPLSRWRATPKAGLGGPFVPLSGDAHAISFDQNLALLQAAVAEQARLAGMVDVIPLRRPIQGPLEVTSPFGARVDPFLGQAAMHTGVDLVEAYGAPVRATASGTVTIAGADGGYGNMVEVDHGDGLVTRYAHLSSLEVVAHQKVSAGAIVGRVGSTGRSTGTHLHYETRINGMPVDPTRFLKAGASLFQG